LPSFQENSFIHFQGNIISQITTGDDDYDDGDDNKDTVVAVVLFLQLLPHTALAH
jgi:hypothetical protein